MVQTMVIEKEKPVDEVLETLLSKIEDKVNEIKASEKKAIPKSLLSELEKSGVVYNGKVLHGIGYDIFVEPETGNHYKLVNGNFEEIKINRPESLVYIVEMEE